MTNEVSEEMGEFGEIFVSPDLTEVRGNETFTDQQVLEITSSAREVLEDTEVGPYSDGVVALLDAIFDIDLLGHEKTVAMMLGALPPMNTEAQNDPPVRQEPKDACVVVRFRKSNLIQKVIGPITDQDAYKICSGFNSSQQYLATKFDLGAMDESIFPIDQ